MRGYEGYLNDKVVTLSEILKGNGYHTMVSGMWHLGLKPERSTRSRGFERSLALLPGCSNHYVYEHVEEGLPRFLEMSTIALHMEDGHYLKELPKDWYLFNEFGDRILHYLKQWRERGDDRPFFAYYPFSAPHWRLQASKKYIDRYRGVYDDGPEALN